MYEFYGTSNKRHYNLTQNVCARVCMRVGKKHKNICATADNKTQFPVCVYVDFIETVKCSAMFLTKIERSNPRKCKILRVGILRAGQACGKVNRSL